MQRLLFALVMAAVIGGSALAGGARTALPGRPLAGSVAGRIDSISPREGRPGDLVTIRGIGFGAGNVRIRVRGVDAPVTAATGDQVTFIVPDGALVGLGTVEAINPGSQGGEIAFRVLLKMTTDPASAATAVIGVGGGTVTASRRGITYALTIPAGALDADTSISVTPVVSAANLPFSNGVPAAAQFEPSGLTLHRTGKLTITMPASQTAAGLLGFVTDNDGRTVEIMKPGLNGASFTIPVGHFSAGGAGSAAVADFERQIRPLLNAVPASLAPTQVDTLITAFVSWFDPQIFPENADFAVCRQTSLCAEVLATAQTSLLQSQAAACLLAAGFLDRPRPEPFSAREAVAPVMHIVAKLTELAALATAANIPGFETQFDLSCLAETLGRIVDAAAQLTLDNPRIGPLMLIVDVASDAALLGMDDVQRHAVATLAAVINELVARGDQTCSTDPDAGEMLLDMILNNTSLDFLNGIETGLGDRARDTRAGCRIRISPLAPSLIEGDTVLFAGNVVGITPSTVTWSLPSLTHHSSIDPLTGLFTAGDIQGAVEVLATSTAHPELFRRTTVTILDQCAPAPVEPETGGPSAAQVTAPLCISVAPLSVSLVTGQAQQFTATVTGGTNQAVVWTATGGTISATGLFTAGAASGAFKVRAASVVDPTVFGEAAVAVTAGTPVAADSNVQIEIGVVNAVTATEVFRQRLDASNGFDPTNPYPSMPLRVQHSGPFVGIPPECDASPRCMPSTYTVEAVATTPVPPTFFMLPSVGIYSGEANCSASGATREVDGFLLLPELAKMGADVRGDMTVRTSASNGAPAPPLTLTMDGSVARSTGIGDLGGGVTITARLVVERVSAGVQLPKITIDVPSYANLNDAAAITLPVDTSFTVQAPGLITVSWQLVAACHQPSGNEARTRAGSSFTFRYQVTR